MNKTLLTLTAAAGLATVAGLAMPTVASADDWHHGRPGGHREHWHRGHDGHRGGGYWHNGYYRPAPRHYHGRPVAYYPRPVYYQPVAYHPVPYYAQPGIGLSFNFR